jgi:hypothetical protein
MPLTGATPPAPQLAGNPAAPHRGQTESARDLLAVDSQGLASLLQNARLNGGTPAAAAAPPVPSPYPAAANGHAAWAAAPPTAPPPPPPTAFGAPPPGVPGPLAATAPPPVAAPPLQLSGELRAVLQRRFSSLLCPITLEPFQEPVVAADGNIYERRAIEEWLYRWV